MSIPILPVIWQQLFHPTITLAPAESRTNRGHPSNRHRQERERRALAQGHAFRYKSPLAVSHERTRKTD
jgi:hypothetical protein